MTPIPLRTVRPFVLEALVLTEAAEEEGFEVSDQMEVTKFLKTRVRGSLHLLYLIDKPALRR
jgi:double-strand break repair protein MRE11